MRTLPTLLLATLLAACAGDPAAPVAPSVAPLRALAAVGEAVPHLREHGVFMTTQDMNGRLVTAACEGEEGELVSLAGQVAEQWNFVSTGRNGDFTVSTFHSRPLDLTGVGLTTGHAYRVDDRAQTRAESSGGGSGGLARATLRLRDLDTGAAYALQYSIRWAFDAEGNLVTDRRVERVACRI